MRIDTTYPEVDFSFSGHGGQRIRVATLEETMFPAYYFRHANRDDASAAPQSGGQVDRVEPQPPPIRPAMAEITSPALEEGHRTFAENQKGVNFDLLFGPYLRGAKTIKVTDPYIRLFYQARNLMEFVETVARQKAPEDEITIHLITSPDGFNVDKQQSYFTAIESACTAAGMVFT
jgi:ATP-dependent Lon protease